MSSAREITIEKNKRISETILESETCQKFPLHNVTTIEHLSHCFEDYIIILERPSQTLNIGNTDVLRSYLLYPLH